MIEIEDKNSELDKEKSFTEFCELIVKTTEDGKTTKEEKEGVQIKGKDVIYLNAPLIFPSKDTPLLTDAQDVAGAINELFGYGEGGGDDYIPPEMPEPEAYEIYFLVEVVDISDSYTSRLQITLSEPKTLNTGGGNVVIDWGDGVIDEFQEHEWNYYNLLHNYLNVGRYLVKITTTEESCNLQRIEPTGGMQYAKVIGAKLGSEIVLSRGEKQNGTQTTFNDQIRLRYVKLSGKNGLPKSCFVNCRSLMRIDLTAPLEKILSYQFSGCVNLKKLDFSQVAEIEDYGLQNTGFVKLDLAKCQSIGIGGVTSCVNLQEINAPLCKAVGNTGLSNCYILEDVTFSDSCTFGTNCFQNCYSLFPRPDGSVN